MHEELPSSSPVPMLLLPAVERVAFVATRATCFNWTLSHGLEPARRIDAYRSPGRALLARFNVVTSLSEYASPRREWQFRPFLRSSGTGREGFFLGWLLGPVAAAGARGVRVVCVAARTGQFAARGLRATTYSFHK
jgi:hypothetical protein